jgi:hypothetical protein
VSSIPFWLVALILACVAPYGAALVQAFLDSSLRRRTIDVLSRAAGLDGVDGLETSVIGRAVSTTRAPGSRDQSEPSER